MTPSPRKTRSTSTAKAGSTDGWDRARQLKRDRDSGPLWVPGDVLKCLDELGIQVLRITGDEAVARCPGHFRLVGKEDNDPSWSVNTQTGVHNCFACGFRGPFAAVVREILDLPSHEADAWVRARGSLDRVEHLLTGGYIHDLTQQAKDRITEADLALCVPPPRDVLRTRNITASAAAAYGILYDAMKHSWITPIRDPKTGELWGWQEKAVEGRLFRNRPRHVEKSRTVFGLDQPSPGRLAIMVESPLDAAVIGSAGIPGALSSFGAGVSDTQMQIVLENFDALILALDNDPDGRKATDRIYTDWHRRLRIQVMPYLVKVKDPGEMTYDEIRRCLGAARLPWVLHDHR